MSRVLRWAEWGRALTGLHIGDEHVALWSLKRAGTPGIKARAAGRVVIDLLARITAVSVETMHVVAAMKEGPR